MVEGRAIAAALMDEGGAELAEALVGTIFVSNAGDGTGFEIIRVDRFTATVTITRMNGQPFDALLASGDVEPTATFATAWTADIHARDLRTLRVAGITTKFECATRPPWPAACAIPSPASRNGAPRLR